MVTSSLFAGDQTGDMYLDYKIRRFTPFSTVYARFKVPWHTYEWRVMGIHYSNKKIRVDRIYRDVDMRLNPHLQKFYTKLCSEAAVVDKDNNVTLYGIGSVYKREDIIKREGPWGTLLSEFPDIQEVRFRKTDQGYAGAVVYKPQRVMLLRAA